MTEAFNDPLARLLELASLPPGDPGRKELDVELSRMPVAERARWTKMIHETDLLYTGLPEVDVPPDLESRLLKIPHAAADAKSAPAPTAPIAKIGPRRWKLYAACLLILLPIAGVALWNMPHADTTPISYALATDKADEVANLAEQLHLSPPALAVTSSDPATVEKALNDAMKPYNMPFPAMMLPPKSPATLLGGGVASFGSTHAAFTRWTSGKETVTLYQFDGKPLNLPAGFDKALVTAKGGHYVSIWPGYGNPCTWALVSDTKPGAELFD